MDLVMTAKRRPGMGGNKVVKAISLSEDLFREAKLAADQDLRSFSNYIEKLVTDDVARRESPSNSKIDSESNDGP